MSNNDYHSNSEPHPFSSSFESPLRYSPSISNDGAGSTSYGNMPMDYADQPNYPPVSNFLRSRPLTKQVNQLAYELPQNKYAKNPWSYAPEFLKVFSDIRVADFGRAVFDCVLLGSPRPKHQMFGVIYTSLFRSPFVTAFEMNSTIYDVCSLIEEACEEEQLDQAEVRFYNLDCELADQNMKLSSLSTRHRRVLVCIHDT